MREIMSQGLLELLQLIPFSLGPERKCAYVQELLYGESLLFFSFF